MCTAYIYVYLCIDTCQNFDVDTCLANMYACMYMVIHIHTCGGSEIDKMGSDGPCMYASPCVD